MTALSLSARESSADYADYADNKAENGAPAPLTNRFTELAATPETLNLCNRRNLYWVLVQFGAASNERSEFNEGNKRLQNRAR